jgi:hypothetical protein
MGKTKQHWLQWSVNIIVFNQVEQGCAKYLLYFDFLALTNEFLNFSTSHEY